MADYPAKLPHWTTKRDFDDPIFAVHFNRVQEELSATEVTVGLMPQKATNNPARLTPDYGTVTSRVQASARAEPMITYRGHKQGANVIPNEYYRPPMDTDEDTHGGATGTGYRLPQTGYWVITLKADWLPVEDDTACPITRSASIEIDGNDLGIRDALVQNNANRDSMTTSVTWQENLVEGTHISTVLCSSNPNPSAPIAVAHVYLHIYLVRCLNEGGSGLPSQVWTPDPPPPPTPKPPQNPQPPRPSTPTIPPHRDPPPVYDDGCQNFPGLQFHPAGASYSEEYGWYSYDSSGSVVRIINPYTG